MKKLLTHLQHYLLTGIMLFGSFGTFPNPAAHLTTSETVPPSTTPSETTEDNEGDDSDDEDPDESANIFQSDLIIRAFHPGYDDDKNSDVGEFIELLNLTDDSLELAGYSLVYTGSGQPSPIFTFPEGSYLTGKRLLLRYEKSPKAEADLFYKVGTKGLAKTGKLELFYDEELKDSVCWTTKKSQDCITRTDNYTTLVRNLTSDTFEFMDMEDYDFPVIEPDTPNLYIPPDPTEDPDENEDPNEPTLIPSQCRGLEFSELLSYYEQDKSEQFIEFFNPTSETIILDGCKVGFKNKTYDLSGEVPSGGYYAYYQSAQFSLTKNPKNPLVLTLIDTDEEILDEVAYSNGQKKSTSFAKIFDSQGNETWQITYAITPHAENIYQKFRSCEEGKVINEATGNCVKVTTLKTTTETLKSTVASLAACPAGKYRNPLTGRCKNIETTSSTLKECAEGYERNPETNRCRKVQSTSANDGTDYALTPTIKSDKTIFIGAGIVGIIILAGVSYVVLQFRHEILRAARKARQRFNHIRKDLFTRKVSRHRNQKP